MRYPGFCGVSNPTVSVLGAYERTVNWLLEPSSPTQPTPMLVPVPGTRQFIRAGDITDVSVRGGIDLGTRAFLVIGAGFYEIFANGTATKRGALAQDANPATVSYNGLSGGQLFITSGTNGYCYTLATNVLTLVLAGLATQGGMLSNRFLAFNVATGQVRLSAQNDGTTWDPTLFFSRSLAADPWKAMLISPPNIWLIGSQTGEVWYDSGAFPQPFAPLNGAFFNYGTVASFSAQVVGEYVTWLSQLGPTGALQAVAARGYAPSQLSTTAIEHTWAGFARTSTVSDAEALSYGDDGHLFACFTFPTARSTWAFDFSTGAWAERGSWNAAQNRYEAWSPRVHLSAFGLHLVGSRTSGLVSALDPTVGTEADGTPIRRLRRPSPLLATPKARIVVDRFEPLFETGLGAVAGQGVDPQVLMRVSYDGQRWGPERSMSAGVLGDYRRRVVFNRCGSSDRLWVPEIVCTDPIPWRCVGADIQGTGFAAQERAA